jgi:hypothetical protein
MRKIFLKIKLIHLPHAVVVTCLSLIQSVFW